MSLSRHQRFASTGLGAVHPSTRSARCATTRLTFRVDVSSIDVKTQVRHNMPDGSRSRMNIHSPPMARRPRASGRGRPRVPGGRSRSPAAGRPAMTCSQLTRWSPLPLGSLRVLSSLLPPGFLLPPSPLLAPSSSGRMAQSELRAPSGRLAQSELRDSLQARAQSRLRAPSGLRAAFPRARVIDG